MRGSAERILNMKDNSTKIIAPWYTYQKKLNALFGEDSDIEVGAVELAAEPGVNYTIRLEVKNHEKFLALDRAISKRVQFGGVVLSVTPVDVSDGSGETVAELYRTIFDGNRIVKDIKEVSDFAGAPHGFIRFWPDVIQFPNDDTSDYNGNWSGLAMDIAREVFGECGAGIHFCTADIRENES